MSEPSLKIAFGLHRAGNLSEAARLYGEILRTEPANFDALYLLGFVHFQRSEFADAERLMGEALKFNPVSIDALYNRASALMKLKRHEEALVLFDGLLTINPAVTEAWAGKGKALLDIRRYAEALASFDKALALGGGKAETWTNRGVALSAEGRAQDALESYDRALAIRLDAATLNNRGNVLCHLKRFEDAALSYEKLLTLDPQFRYARGSLAFCRLQCCDWRSLEDERERISADLRAGVPAAQPGSLLALSYSPEDQLRCARMWVANEVRAVPPLWQGERYHHERIRVAYLSGDFRAHAVTQLMVGVFEHHDRERFETVAISLGTDDNSAIRRRVMAAFNQFVDARGKDDFEIARLIKGMDVDIAVDLMGYTQGSRPNILAHRVAPVQAQYLGFPGTTGANNIDYILADPIVIPKECQEFYSENVVYLPDSYQCNDSKRRIGERGMSRAEAGLPQDGFVFASFNHSFKVTRELFGIWLSLLRAVDGSVLWLLESHPVAVRNLQREAEKLGIASHRLVFAPLASPEDHLARLRLADLFLDTLPYNAHTTASDALWAGLPVLTCLGSTFAGRVAASLLHAAGLAEMVTHSLPEYEALALKLARDPAALSAVKVKLASNRLTCPLFDTARFTRAIETAYRTMLERANRGLPPAAFAVERQP